jgi:thioredoxin-related protein
LRRALAALALLCALAPAAAAEGWEKFFELSFGDLREEAAEARKSGRQGLLVMYHFDECPYCQRMKQEVLLRPEVQAWYRKRFRAIAVDTRGAQEVTGFSGKALPEKEFARAAGVRATPSFQFYALDGALLATQAGAIYDPAEFILLGEYVASGAYRQASFAAYKQSKQKRGS